VIRVAAGWVGSRDGEEPKLGAVLPWGFRGKRPIIGATLGVGFEPLI